MTVQYQKILSNLDAMIESELQSFLIALSSLINSKAPIAFGRLSSSFIPIFSNEGEPAEAGKKVGAVGSPLWNAYGQYVEFGTRPHWAPLEPLIQWANQKFKYKQIGVEFSTGRALPTRRGTKKFSQREIEKIAENVRFKIAQRGTRAQKFVEESLKEIGVDYEVVTTSTDIYYLIDMTKYLEQHGNIIDRSAEGT